MVEYEGNEISMDIMLKASNPGEIIKIGQALLFEDLSERIKVTKIAYDALVNEIERLKAEVDSVIKEISTLTDQRIDLRREVEHLRAQKGLLEASVSMLKKDAEELNNSKT